MKLTIDGVEIEPMPELNQKVIKDRQEMDKHVDYLVEIIRSCTLCGSLKGMDKERLKISLGCYVSHIQDCARLK